MFIAIDGIDGAGKGTQCRRLADYFNSNGATAKVVSFPVYDSFFGAMISEYLNGGYGSLYAINPKLTALLYAMDRKLYFERNPLDGASAKNNIIIFDRYVLSNMAHQGIKVEQNKREVFFSWLIELEFDINKIPRPDVSIVLDIDSVFSAKNVAKKEKRSYTDKTHDIHERDAEYLSNVRSLFAALAESELRTMNTHLIKCDNDGALRSEDEVAADIIKTLGHLN